MNDLNPNQFIQFYLKTIINHMKTLIINQVNFNQTNNPTMHQNSFDKLEMHQNSSAKLLCVQKITRNNLYKQIGIPNLPYFHKK